MDRSLRHRQRPDLRLVRRVARHLHQLGAGLAQVLIAIILVHIVHIGRHSKHAGDGPSCVYMDSTDGSWAHNSCSDNMGAICRKGVKQNSRKLPFSLQDQSGSFRGASGQLRLLIGSGKKQYFSTTNTVYSIIVGHSNWQFYTPHPLGCLPWLLLRHQPLKPLVY